MKRSMAKAIAVVLSMSMIMSLVTTSVDVDAAKKVKLSKKSVTLAIGKSSTITIKNVKAKKIKKLTVKSSNKKVAAVKRNGKKKTAFKVTGKAKGSAKIQVKLHLRGQKKPKKLTLKVKVTQKGNVPNVQPTVAPAVTSETTGSAGGTMTPTASGAPIVKPTEVPAVTPEATGPASTSASGTLAPTASGTPTSSGVPTASGVPTVSGAPTSSGAPIMKPTEVPVVTPGATEPASVTMKPIATVKPTVKPAVKPTATPGASVTDALQIESVMVTENHKLMIFLNEPSRITTDILVIKTKKTEQDSYGEALRIKSINKIDPLQYEVELDDTTSGNYIVNNGYVQVSVARTSEAPLVAEAQFECESVTITREWVHQFTLGTNNRRPHQNLWNEDFVGELQCKVIGDMPDGMDYSLNRRDLYVKGTPEKVGVYQFKLDITDEAGNNLVFNCTSLVGDTEHIYAAAFEEHILKGKKEETYVRAAGGGGSYTYTKVEGNHDFTVDSTGKVTAEFAEAGTYQLYVDVADVKNPNLKTRVTVVYHVEGICELSGAVTDLGGTGLFFRGGGLKIYVIPQDREIRSRYSLHKPMASLRQLNSIFSIEVPAGIYDIRFESDFGSVYKVMKDVEVKGSHMSLGTIELPVCQVNLKAPNKDNLYQIYWRDEEGVLIGRNETFLVRPGTYTLHSDPDISPVMASLYDFTVTFTAADDTVRKVVTAAPTGDRITDLTLESDIAVSLDSTLEKWYKFTPKETGTYRFYSTGLEENMWFDVYSDKQYENSDYHYLTFTYKRQTCENGNQVNCLQTLDAGTTYYISLDLMRDDMQDDFVFGVEKTK